MKWLQASVGCQTGRCLRGVRPVLVVGERHPDPSRAGRMCPRWVVFGAIPIP